MRIHWLARLAYLTLGGAGLTLSACGFGREPGPPPAREDAPPAASQAADSGTAGPVRAAGRAALEADAPRAGAIRADILVINDTALSADEVRYAVREEVLEARQAQSGIALRDALIEIVRRQTQTEVGTLLVFAEALRELSDPQQEALESVVKREVERRVAAEFGGSKAAFVAHLGEFRITPAQYDERVKRRLIVQSYARERLMPQTFLRRDELLSYYRENTARFSTPETRTLFMIELPFESFLPAGQSWVLAPEPARRRAKLAAVRAARQAHELLASRPFEEVAREHSRGPRAAEGGAWGEIGGPLKPPYDEVSRRIFSFAPGQTSEPIETPHGWCIVKCGQVTPARQRSFADAQADIRAALEEERFNRLSSEYIVGLATKAEISDLSTFLESAVMRALRPEWPRTRS